MPYEKYNSSPAIPYDHTYPSQPYQAPYSFLLSKPPYLIYRIDMEFTPITSIVLPHKMIELPPRYTLTIEDI
jgi:hypothetical protein